MSACFCASPFTWPGEKKLIPLQPHNICWESGMGNTKKGEEKSRGLQVRRAARSHQGTPLSLPDNCCIWHFNGNWGRARGREGGGGGGRAHIKGTRQEKRGDKSAPLSFLLSRLPPSCDSQRGEFLLDSSRGLAPLKPSSGWIDFMGLTEQNSLFFFFVSPPPFPFFFFVCVFNEKERRIYIK